MMRLAQDGKLPKAISGARTQMTYGARIRALLGENGVITLLVDKMVGVLGEDAIKVPVDGVILVKFEDSTSAAGWIKVQ